MSGISFNVSKFDAKIIREIAKRARSLEARHGGEVRDQMDWVMDFTATHANGNPLNLSGLLAADDFNFAHDAFDARTGQGAGACFNIYAVRTAVEHRTAARRDTQYADDLEAALALLSVNKQLVEALEELRWVGNDLRERKAARAKADTDLLAAKASS